MFNDYIVLSPAEIRRQSATAACPVGTRGITGDGRTFFYAKAGEGINVGSLVKTQTDVTQSINSTINKVTEELTSTFSTLHIATSGGVTEAYSTNYFAGGMLWVKNFHSDTDASGGGQYVKIKSNTSLAASDSTGFYVYLADDERFVDSVTSTAKIGLIPNRYMDVAEWDASATLAMIVGVAPIDVTDTYYFWCQSWGPAAVSADACTLGSRVTPSTATSTDDTTHQASPITRTTASDLASTKWLLSANINQDGQTIGYPLATSGTALDFALIFLTISP